MARKYRIGVIEGDGIGPEIVGAALTLLDLVNADFDIVRIEAGLRRYRKEGIPISEEDVAVLKGLDATIKGPITTLPGRQGYRSVNVYLRKRLGLYANVRPFRSYRGLSLRDIDVVIVRENTEGLYSGIEWRVSSSAFSLRVITEEGSRKIVRFAFEYASSRRRSKVTAVHKANILKESDGLFREVFHEEAVRYPSIAHDEVFVDAAAYLLVKNPGRFDVIVTPNLYGDILSDLAAGVAGSLGLFASAQVGEDTAVFEPVHGTAPDIAGKGIANPTSAMKALAMMLDYLGTKHGDRYLTLASSAIEEGIKRVIEERRSLTPDIGGSASTNEFAAAVRAAVQELLASYS